MAVHIAQSNQNFLYWFGMLMLFLSGMKIASPDLVMP